MAISNVDAGTCMRVLDACQLVLQRAGCTVTRVMTTDNTATLTVTLPDKPSDPHGERLKAAIEATT